MHTSSLIEKEAVSIELKNVRQEYKKRFYCCCYCCCCCGLFAILTQNEDVYLKYKHTHVVGRTLKLNDQHRKTAYIYDSKILIMI